MFNAKWLHRPDETRRFQEKRREQAPLHLAGGWGASLRLWPPQPRPRVGASLSDGSKTLAAVGSGALRSEEQA